MGEFTRSDACSAPDDPDGSSGRHIGTRIDPDAGTSTPTNHGRSVMHPTPNGRERFTDGTLMTASGPKVIVLCYERLDRDLTGAIDAIEHRQLERAHELLCHAQDVVHEMRCMIDLGAWEHAPQLSSIYAYLTDLLVTANVRKCTRVTGEARALLAELADGFKRAAASVATATAPARLPSGAARDLAEAGSPSPAPSMTPRAFSMLA
jgi:flagellar secretion chaperone FliS